MFRSQQLSAINETTQRQRNWRVLELIGAAICCSAVISIKASAQTDYQSASMPEAHFWEELPGYQSAKPQASVVELLGPKPLTVSVDQLQHMQQRDQRETYRLLTDAQQARRDAERETAASRIGETNWHYGWGVGFEDVKFRLSYDF